MPEYSHGQRRLSLPFPPLYQLSRLSAFMSLVVVALLVGTLIVPSGLQPASNAQAGGGDAPIPVPTASSGLGGGSGDITDGNAQDDTTAPPPTADDDTLPELPILTPEQGGENIVLNDDFELDLAKWQASANASIIDDGTGNRVLQLLAGETLTPLTASLTNYHTTFWFYLVAPDAITPAEGDQRPAALTGELSIRFRNSYTLLINVNGATLYAESVGEGQGDITAQTETKRTLLAEYLAPNAANSWHQAELRVNDTRTALSINGVSVLKFVFEAQHETGREQGESSGLMFAASPSGTVWLDDIAVSDRTRPELVTPDTDQNPQPAILDFDRAKLGSDLAGMLDMYNASGEAAALELASTYLVQGDGKARLNVEIWASEGTDGAALVALVEAAGGKIETLDYKRVSARLSLAGIASLTRETQVSVITLTPKLTASADVLPRADASLGAANLSVNTLGPTALVPRDPTGSRFSEGYDLSGVQAWHKVEYDGRTVKVAIIDIGFGSPTDNVNNEMTCLANNSAITLAFGTRVAGDSQRGLNMLEVVCDVAPQSKVRLYKAQTTDELHDALQAAKANENRVILIGLDLGPNVSPGDGSLGFNSTKNPYTAIQELRDEGAVVIAAAGNSNRSYVAVELTTSSTVTIPITARRGTPINLGWNDWDNNPNGAAPREDFGATLSGAGFSNVTKPARGSSNPGHQFIMPTTCTEIAGFCTATLTLNGLVGNNTLVQVQVGGLDSTINYDQVTGGTIPQGHGRLARPADAANAIAVGAVCPSLNNNYPTLNYSSRGPVYNGGGNFTGLPPDPFFTGNEVKPDVVSSAQVSTSFSQVVNLDQCSEGFGGTQSAAAHVAGQVAVLLSNPTIAQFQQPSSASEITPNVLRYLRTHAAELDFGADANGYDMRNGAGLVVLGQNTYDPDDLPSLSSLIIPDRIPAGKCVGGIVYAGPYRVGNAAMDGTLQNPFTHIAHAVAVAAAAGPNRCVVALPGEYPTPIYANNLANDVQVYSYSSVVRQAAAPSVMVVQAPYTRTVTSGVSDIARHGGVYIRDESFVFSGFTFVQGSIYENAILPESSILVVDNADNVTFSNNTIRNYAATQELSLIQILNGSTDVSIDSNRFINNVPQFKEVQDPPGAVDYLGNLTLILVSDAGSATGRITINGNLFRRNQSPLGIWLIDDLLADGVGQTSRSFQWTSMIRSVDSYIDITNNTMRDNQFETLIQSVTRRKNALFETRIVGNAIVNNKTSSNLGIDDFNPPGPLVHLFFVPRFVFVNNTVAKNDLSASDAIYALIVGRGDEIDENYFESPSNNNSGSLGSGDTFWEYHNNFLIDNIAFGGILNDMDASGVQCKNRAGEQDKGAIRNWIFNSGALGVCAASVDNAANGNLRIDPYPRDANGELIPGSVTYILGGLAANNTTPGYYSLTGASDDSFSEADGVDEGFDTFVLTELPQFAAGLDARGVIRRNDGDGINGIQIDMGAFELTLLELDNPIDLTLNEDAGPVQLDLVEPIVTGGFPPYEVNITRFPRYYGVFGQNGSNCDARFTRLAQGVVVEYLTDSTPIITYCPPPDFHTDTTDPDFDIAQAGFDFELLDASNSVATSTVEIVVNPINDNVLVTTLGNNTPAGDILDEPIAIGRGLNANAVRLRPYVDFTKNFFFSEWDNLIEPNAQNEVDYTFTYGSTSVVDDPGNNDVAYIVDNLQVLSAAQGIIGFDLSTATPPTDGSAQVKLQYTVNDQRGGQVTNIVTIRAELPPSDFDLLTPPNATVFSDFSDVEIFTWEPATPVESYIFTVDRVSASVPENILTLDLTPAADSDNLACTAAVCTLTLRPAQQQLIVPGDYRWSVTADNRGVETVATNAPFIFKVQIGIELLKNGSFEEPQGTNERLAKNWQPAKLDNDRRKCNKTNKIFAFELNCMFQFKGKSGLTSSISQTIKEFGKASERVILSFYSNAKNLTSGGRVSATIKYKNGTKQKINVELSGGSYEYTNFTEARTMPDEAKSAKVTIRMKNGAGRFRIDAVSLVWETGAEFDLLTPVTSETYTSSTGITFMTWERSIGSTGYDLQVIRATIIPTTVLNLTSLTPIVDGDGLSCNDKVCRYVLTPADQALLTNGDYSWEVTAKGGLTQLSQNGPFLFTIDGTVTNLITNGGFDTKSSSKPTLPASWTAKGTADSTLRCNNIAKNKFRAYQGECSFRFVGKPGLNARLEQKPDASQIAAGNSLSLNAVVSGKGVGAGKGKIEAKITYVDNTTEKLTLTLPPGDYNFTLFSDNTAVTKAAAKVKVTVRYQGGSGSFVVDNVTLLRDTTP